ncbi:solute carrier family 66 member 3-like [Clupea harengus]|uniref:Solute carrier family 66 member 3-like n=1 Tax=Clupea harengus TaxID=7950 RepID=A0A6P8GQ53_CLUHA|nr:solute carrier family 66 member 3-like [Clupea harengus]
MSVGKSQVPPRAEGNVRKNRKRIRSLDKETHFLRPLKFESAVTQLSTTWLEFRNSKILPSSDMEAVESWTLLNTLNMSATLICMVLKLPQIILLGNAKSTKGVSLRALLLELTGYIVFASYQKHHGFPIATYLEYPILVAQDSILLLLILHLDGNLWQSLIYSLVFVTGWQLLTWQSWIIDLALSFCTFISGSSKFTQLQCLWASGDAGQVSALSWALSTCTCIARIFTTILSTGDLQVLLRFCVLTTLNGWVFLTVVYYKWHGKKLA